MFTAEFQNIEIGMLPRMTARMIALENRNDGNLERRSKKKKKFGMNEDRNVGKEGQKII